MAKQVKPVKRHANSSYLSECMTEAALLELLSLECRVDGMGSIRYYNAHSQLHRVHGPAVEYSRVGCEWYQNGLLHRLDGPAVEHTDGYRAWWQNGQLHRIDGPAIVQSDGSREWVQNDLLHRIDGPAIVRPDGYRAWWQNGQLHRLDGPAVENSDGDCEWYINGEELTEAEWQQAAASMEWCSA